MAELFESSLPFQGAVLALTLMLCVAPHFRTKGRKIIAALLLLPAVGIVGDLVFFEHDFELTLEVPNVFGRGPEGEPHLWVVDTVTAPLWQYHVVAIGVFVVPALAIWLLRTRPSGAPRPLLMATLVFWFFLASRLLFEATATHRPIVWGFGATVVQIVALPFFGYWCGRRDFGMVRWIGLLVVLGLAQRVPLVAFAWFATSSHLGTHLDVHVITDANLPGIGEMDLATDSQRWLWLILFPQTTIWVGITAVAGVFLGAVPFLLGRRDRRMATITR